MSQRRSHGSRRLAILLIVSALVLLAGATMLLWRPTPARSRSRTLDWDHDLSNVAYFTVTIDDREPIVVRGRTELVLPPDLAPGEHRAVVAACDAKGVCSPSAPLSFRSE